jgi:hypothetical protein
VSCLPSRAQRAWKVLRKQDSVLHSDDTNCLGVGTLSSGASSRAWNLHRKELHTGRSKSYRAFEIGRRVEHRPTNSDRLHHGCELGRGERTSEPISTLSSKSITPRRTPVADVRLCHLAERPPRTAPTLPIRCVLRNPARTGVGGSVMALGVASGPDEHEPARGDLGAELFRRKACSCRDCARYQALGHWRHHLGRMAVAENHRTAQLSCPWHRLFSELSSESGRYEVSPPPSRRGGLDEQVRLDQS